MSENYDSFINKNNIFNIKSKYILKKILIILPKTRLLEIIRYNNYTKELFNINIKDYIMEYYSTIEIEIIPAKNWYGRRNFINLYKKNKNKNYYHFFFNDDKREIRRDYLTKKDNVSKIKIIIDREIKSFQGLFRFCQLIEKINFKKFKRKYVQSLGYMFYDCTALTKIDFSNVKIDKIKDMRHMFDGCESLRELDLSNFKTDCVTNMEGMFASCFLKELDLSNFETNNVTNMAKMFYKCSDLKELDISNFNANNIKKVDDIKNMFHDCSPSLKIICFDNLIINQYKKDI